MKTKKKIAEALGIRCAALLVIIKLDKDKGSAHAELFICCNAILIDYANSLFKSLEEAEIAVGKAWDLFWILFAEGKYQELNKFVGFMNTIILRIFNTRIVDFDKNPIIHIDINEAIENPKNDAFFEDVPDEAAIKRQEDFDNINKAMLTFSAKDQDLRRRYYIEGESQKQIAESLHLTVGYVGKALSRIVNKLRKMLN